MTGNGIALLLHLESPHCRADLAQDLIPPSGQKTLPPLLQGKTPGGLALAAAAPGSRPTAPPARLDRRTVPSSSPQHVQQTHTRTPRTYSICTLYPPYSIRHYPVALVARAGWLAHRRRWAPPPLNTRQERQAAGRQSTKTTGRGGAEQEAGRRPDRPVQVAEVVAEGRHAERWQHERWW